MNYEQTHISLTDKVSTAMLVSETIDTITLVNEDGFEWTDPAYKWARLDDEPFNYDDDYPNDDPYNHWGAQTGAEYMAEMYNSDSYIAYLNG